MGSSFRWNDDEGRSGAVGHGGLEGLGSSFRWNDDEDVPVQSAKEGLRAWVPAFAGMTSFGRMVRPPLTPTPLLARRGAQAPILSNSIGDGERYFAAAGLPPEPPSSYR